MNKELAYVLLPCYLVVVYWRTKQDLKSYNDFKKLRDTNARQQKYRAWTLESLVLFGVGSLVVLGLMGQWHYLVAPPMELSEHVPRAQQILQAGSGAGAGFVVGMLVSSLLLGSFLSWRRSIKTDGAKQKTAILGDVEALLPRNNPERLWGVLLAVNAGFSEELFFRLLLPVLFWIIFGNAVLALVIAVAIFGLVHYYQGVVGIAATAFMGGILTIVFLATRSILAAMVVHALPHQPKLWPSSIIFL